MEANVDDANVIHLAAGAAGGAGEKAKDEGIKPVGGVPVGSHALAGCLTVLGRYFAVLFHKPEEEVHKNDVWLADGRRRALGKTWPQGRHR